MKKLVIAAAAAAVTLLASPAFAGVASQTFNVTANLTSLCRVKTGGSSLGLNFAYTAFGAAQTGVAGGAVIFECTRGLGASPTVAFDVSATGGSSAAGQGATGDGVVNGLAYTLAVSAGAVTTTGTAATATTIGSATEYTYTLTGGLLANQAGTFSASPTTVVRTLLLAY